MPKTPSKRAYGGASGRPKPLTSKASFTKNRARRYSCGGKIKRK